MSKVGVELRVEGLLVRNCRILLAQHTRDNESYWVLPGGHVELGESLPEALVREFREELTLEAAPAELLWVHQFIRPDRHTVNFTFRVECPDPDALRLNSERRLTGCRWFAPDELATIDFRPDLRALCAGVCRGNLPEGVPVYRF